ncbi:Glycine betaine/proline betaine transport system ATP-binding protein ProV [Dickeya dianthicola]|uniref:ATP-binding cassette domain-containing protein n=1 Tax=Dickeya dianthicola TaxID=204039 RepID=A0AAP2GAW3_9GAMM|nr:ATP-binding cassette domain-containing protein [Dickeya dianthicola]AYC20763.1 Glycine betaine/proline betaine transport system ATP-binding protein ProV [Dickeya dianthicola]MBI0439739.1 ATP-binding cassette domain-containing protein [Dickeya dianthicola]MBI0450337.1 ATP-binding cassette domain-containing protein [Dickeya dianthicola]MBI0454864.1 ATP-binding cassette domain-containing protein [Dickeya dianthicola]MBI0458173.1 ATP-binding cassette domain-containing protein [Dickeya dianthico
MSQPIFELRSVNKNYYLDSAKRFFSRAQKTPAVNALNNINLQIYAGEIFVIVGLSGSGKSTLLRTLNHLIPASSGAVIFQGQTLAALKDAELTALRRRHIGMVFQSFALFEERNVLDNVAFGLEVAGVARDVRRQQARDMLAKVGLGDVAAHYPHQLSGGMQQRVGLARALVVNPTVLLMDEAFSALDPIIRREMQSLLLSLQAESQRTLVFVTHDMEEALRLGSRIAIMEQGELVQVGKPETLINAPATAYVRHFFSGVDVSRWQMAENYADIWATQSGQT